MWFAVVACVLCGGLTWIAFRSTKKLPASEPLRRVRLELRHGSHEPKQVHSNEERELRALVQAVEQAGSRRRAVALLNEFVSDVSQHGAQVSKVPRVLGRACLSLGMLLGALALAESFRHGMATLRGLDWGPSLLSVGAGVMGSMLCYHAGRKASSVRSEYREQAELFRKLLEHRLPEEGSLADDRPSRG